MPPRRRLRERTAPYLQPLTGMGLVSVLAVCLGLLGFGLAMLAGLLF